MTLQAIKQMPEQVQRELWRRGEAFLRSKGFARQLSEDELSDLLIEGIEALWRKVHQGEKPLKIIGYYQGILKHLWYQHQRKRTQEVALANEPMGEEPVVSSDEPSEWRRSRERYALLEEVFAQMRAAGRGECEELLRDSYTSSMSDEELCQIYSWTRDYIRQKPKNCREYIQKWAAKHPRFQDLFLP